VQSLCRACAEQATFASEFVGLILATWYFYMKRVSQSFVESRGFFSGVRFPLRTGKVGCVKINTVKKVILRTIVVKIKY
jgi:hypothetical protein